MLMLRRKDNRNLGFPTAFRNWLSWEPIRELADVRRFFDDADLPQGPWAFDVDLRESPEGYVVQADLPGFDKKDLNITLQEGVLTVEAERKEEKSRDEENFHVRERYAGKFHRSFRLPTPVKENQINATLKDGVLRIELAKADEVRPRRIEIHGSETAPRK